MATPAIFCLFRYIYGKSTSEFVTFLQTSSTSKSVTNLWPPPTYIYIYVQVIQCQNFDQMLPWLLKRPQIDFSMHASCKESTPPEIFRAEYYEICDQYQDYCKLYTDGYMSGDQVGSATICGTITKTV